jgi:hypothetical protein
MVVGLLPRTSAGKWAFSLICATEFAVVGLLSAQAMGDPLRGLGSGTGWSGRPLFALFSVIAVGAALGAVVTGGWAIGRRHERAASVVGAIALGLLVVAIAVNELMA